MTTGRELFADMVRHKMNREDQEAEITRLTSLLSERDELLKECREKLEVYFNQTGGKYEGGPIYASLIKRIDSLSATAKEG